MGTHLKVLGEGHMMNTNMTGFRWFSEIFAFLCFEQKCSLSIRKVINTIFLLTAKDMNEFIS